MFCDAAQHWYHARKTANNNQAPRWDILRTALLEHFDPPARIDELHTHLNRLAYCGSMSEYVRLFQGIEIQIPASDMTLGDRKHRFLSSLPTELAMQLIQLKHTDMAAICRRRTALCASCAPQLRLCLQAPLRCRTSRQPLP